MIATQLLIGTVLVLLTVIFQALAFDIIIRKTRHLTALKTQTFRRFKDSFTIAVVTIAVSFVMIAEVWLWAVFYFAVQAVPDFETALYFSTSAFTTVGFGDVYLDKDWRLLSSIEAMNGFLMFGWSAAFLYEIVSHVYKQEGSALD